MLEACINSDLSEDKVDKTFQAYVNRYIKMRPDNFQGTLIIGNKVLIEKYLPLSFSILHYRIIDLSKILQSFRLFYYNLVVLFKMMVALSLLIDNLGIYFIFQG